MILDTIKLILSILIGLAVAIAFPSCEQEREADLSELHPFPGETPVLFSFLQSGSKMIETELYTTGPLLDTSANNYITGAEVTLIGPRETSKLDDMGDGIFTDYLDHPLQSEESYYISVATDRFGSVQSNTVVVPSPIRISRYDSVHDKGKLYLTAEFQPLQYKTQSFSQRLLRYGAGKILNASGIDKLPIPGAELPVRPGIQTTREYSLSPYYTVFDPQTKVPSDTIRVDSIHLILYTWGPEVAKFNASVRESSNGIGDGTEPIENTTWSNIEGGYGLVAGFATDTLTIVF